MENFALLAKGGNFFQIAIGSYKAGNPSLTACEPVGYTVAYGNLG